MTINFFVFIGKGSLKANFYITLCSALFLILVSIVLSSLFRRTSGLLINTHKVYANTDALKHTDEIPDGLVVKFRNQSVHYKNLFWKTPSSFNIIYANEATIILPSGLVFNLTNVFDFGKWYWTNAKHKIQHNEEHEFFDGLVFTFIQIWNDAFQHIVFDTLPKAFLACGWLQKYKNVDILVCNELQMKLIQSACILPTKRFLVLKKRTKFKGMYLSYFGDSVYKMGLVPARCLTSLGPQETQGSDVIYLPRKQDKPRSVSNEKEVLLLLKRYWPNIQVFYPTNNWQQDKTFFNTARVIIGPHGGALSNMIFAPVNSTIIEFLPIERLVLSKQNERPCYFGLAKGLGFTYYAVEPNPFSFNGKMNVPLERIETIIKLVFKAFNN